MHFQSLVIYFCLYYYSSNHDKIGKYFKSKIHISTYYSCAFYPQIQALSLSVAVDRNTLVCV